MPNKAKFFGFTTGFDDMNIVMIGITYSFYLQIN